MAKSLPRKVKVRFNFALGSQTFGFKDVCLQYNLAEEEPERAALMAERLKELGATMVKY